MKKYFFLSVLIFASCSNLITQANVEAQNITQSTSELGSPMFTGELVNTGGIIAHNITVEIDCYREKTIIDTAKAWGLSDLKPGETVLFEAPYYKAVPEDIESYEVRINWD